MKVGDILVYAYSYNARYPHFVRITRMTKSFIWVEDVPKKWYEHDGFEQNGQVVPNFKAQTTPVKGRLRFVIVRTLVNVPELMVVLLLFGMVHQKMNIQINN